MIRIRPLSRAAAFATAVFCLSAGLAAAEPKHGIAMYGEPALPPDFVAFPYANPDAPTGGRIVTGEVGSFDSLNPYIRKGSVPWQLRFLTSESLMARNWDEPFTLYGLLAESVETDPDRTWVEFTLRPEAAFSDGSPVTVEDVIWSYETLGTEGHPRYLGAWEKVESIEAVGERTVRITFNTADRELALIMGLRPILKKTQWEDTDFTDSGLDELPILTGPYVIDRFEAGRYVSLKRNPDYWGKDLPVTAGHANLDEIRMEFYADGTAQFEAFKAGELNSNREFNASKWDEQYDFPAVQAGDVIKSLVPHGRPSGITGFVMNTRNPEFQDWRVRDALIHAFNFEFINQTQTGGQNPRITSYFSNSLLGMDHGPAEGLVREMLEPFADQLLPGTLEGYSLPVSDGSVRNRANISRALDLFREAGWTVKDGVLSDEAGNAFEFEILLESGAAEAQTFIDIYVESLKRIGIFPTVNAVDTAQYNERTQIYDFDMTLYRVALSLSPGNEQYYYWGPEGLTEPGTKNWMGMDSPAAVAMIDRILNARSNDEFVAATKALDRILTAGRYVIPTYQYNTSRIAHVKELRFPEHIPIYGDWLDWQPLVWWWEEE
ncbi:extracellular solute-binding protein [Psychromarinibacter halotolerans]|uniref:Extracellular solute-binding protein n=1 Tax=Psychromarinibacter halotolerans TaxID=1775175 RepID=A0ABV7GQH8_9RHOB|nr:extracellular solute-binding protein [Psychromarinibacter halotolerans]MDF0594929.1 extracellular solute-binding protein [Psychromarinibacter halotolerans]